MDNVVGTVNVMDWARSLDGLEKMIYFSTDEVFGLPQKELSTKNGTDTILQARIVQVRRVLKS